MGASLNKVGYPERRVSQTLRSRLAVEMSPLVGQAWRLVKRSSFLIPETARPADERHVTPARLPAPGRAGRDEGRLPLFVSSRSQNKTWFRSGIVIGREFSPNFPFLFPLSIWVQQRGSEQ